MSRKNDGIWKKPVWRGIEFWRSSATDYVQYLAETAHLQFRVSLPLGTLTWEAEIVPEHDDDGGWYAFGSGPTPGHALLAASRMLPDIAQAVATGLALAQRAVRITGALPRKTSKRKKGTK